VSTITHPERVESYEQFFGLREPPFSLAPNPKFMFESESHAKALAQVAYALERREPLVVITGEIGAGKTLLCRTVLQRVKRKTFVSVINDPQLERDDLLKHLLQDFGVISKDPTRLPATSRHDLFDTLQTFLASLIPLQAHAVVIIDEAQYLKPEVLEQIRLLSNIDDDRGTMLQIILVGQTDLEPVLARPELRQFQQRVTRRFRLLPLPQSEVSQYINHRLAIAGAGMPAKNPASPDQLETEVAGWAKAGSGAIFTPEAIAAVAKLSAGFPRVINVVCDRALEEAYRLRTRKIDVPIINAAARALSMPEPVASAHPTPQPPAAKPVADSADFDIPLPTIAVRPRPVSAPRIAEPPARPAHPPRPLERTPRTERPPVAFGSVAQHDDTSSTRKWILFGVLGVVALVAIWFLMASPSPAPSSPAPPAASEPPSAPATLPPPPTNVAPPTEPAAPPAATPPAASASSPPAAPPAAAASGGERFEIIVASFRTDARAAQVAGEVTALGLPSRRRVSDGWQQVLAGPFASRSEASSAQQRLDDAGLTATKIVPLP
jgi:type II secretory pathway predicted ATPase ExeA